MFDTHCHPHLNRIKDTHRIISEYFLSWWEYINCIGTDPETNTTVLELAHSFPQAYCSIGIHPCDIWDLDLWNTMEWLKKQYQNNKNKIIALWETGLDYYWVKKDAEKYFPDDSFWQEQYIAQIKGSQKQFFRAHILLAKELSLPIVIHNRDAKNDVLKILQENNFKNFIFHCYSENLDYAKRLIDFAPDCKISFSGIVTFKNAKDIQETAKNIDLKHIICETDAPYLTPSPLRGKEENEPKFTKYVIDYICALRSETHQIIEKQIFQNSLDIFAIKK